MKNIQTKTFIGLATVVLVFLSGCSKILDEQPRSNFTPDYFKTENGVLGGITSLYAHLRNIYGQAYYYMLVLPVLMKQHTRRAQMEISWTWTCRV